MDIMTTVVGSYPFSSICLKSTSASKSPFFHGVSLFYKTMEAFAAELDGVDAYMDNDFHFVIFYPIGMTGGKYHRNGAIDRRYNPWRVRIDRKSVRTFCQEFLLNL